ncbi:hypothetical protein H1Z61_14810 [Bacillus aquiflavi]|uniref:YycO n=1 Tax=Bacillus aquiflavi TaxID=2672567 RepID=A0A6B3W0M0_9BACI|nr:hypothetical protein [Bacillus aquiflavi]MBA4538367.1 hypothetical protein [Bacillus aquiflavi]NEY82732.1 hypothetical protein [Bacillus aquiflavi]UAC49525.1 hypothetical protein K6959_06775 [Bacillus aquiflavi]
MKKLAFLLSLLLIVVPTQGFAQSSSDNHVSKDQIDKILSIYQNVSKQEIMKEINQTSKALGISKGKVADQMYSELKEQQDLAAKEEPIRIASPGSGGTTVIDSSTKGNIFYETAATALIEHGHVGMYYTADTLVESVPSYGVRSLNRSNKKVGEGARIMTVSNTTSTEKNSSANWAYNRIGESYSYNFATNRLTSCTGDKNCSKLVWCAWKNVTGLDLDSNGGLGVYPKDIRDHSRVTAIKYY